MLNFIECFFYIYLDVHVVLYFSVNIICYIIGFHMLNQPYIPGVNPTLSWCKILFTCCNIQLVSIFFVGLHTWVCLFFFFVRLHSWHMEVPRLGVKLELQLLAYATATAMPDPSCIWDIHCSSQQWWNLSPLRGPGNQTHILWILVGFVTAEPLRNSLISILLRIFAPILLWDIGLYFFLVMSLVWESG